MRLVNNTPAIAYLNAIDLLESQLRTVVIVKMTYILSDSGELSIAPDAMPLVADAAPNDFGCIHGELFFRKRDIDLCVLGTVRRERPVERAKVRLSVGTFVHDLDVYGDRVWKRGPEGLTSSTPEPFNAMPLSYARAYGGKAIVRGEEVPWPENPDGRGYYESEALAVGAPLPNIELPSTPIRTWDQRGPVAGWAPYPMFWGMRATRAVKVDEVNGRVLDVSTELFNHAHPDLIVPSLPPEARLRIEGLHERPIQFALPAKAPKVLVEVGTTSVTALGELDGVFVWADSARVVLTWRARFTYPVRPEETRRATLSFD